MYVNDGVLQKLPQAENTGWIEAHLILFDPGLDGATDANQGNMLQAPSSAGAVWTFLYNPSALQYDRKANYSEAGPLGSRIGYRHYVNTTGETLNLSNIFMQTWFDGRSMQPLIDGLNSLMEARFGSGKFTPPPVLSFVWGTKRFGPCVLDSFNRSESAWLGGAPGRMTVSIDLSEVPVEQATGNQQDQDLTINEDAPAVGSPRSSLTEAQAAQASRFAKQYLVNQVNSWSPQIQALVQSGNYSLRTDRTTGDVHMIGANQADLGIILRSNGVFTSPDGTLRSGPLTTVPRAQSATLPETLDIAALSRSIAESGLQQAAQVLPGT